MRNNYSLRQQVSLQKTTNPIHTKKSLKINQDQEHSLIVPPQPSPKDKTSAPSEMQWLSKILGDLKNYQNHSNKQPSPSPVNQTPTAKIEKQSLCETH